MGKGVVFTIGIFFGVIGLSVINTQALRAAPSSYDECSRDCNREAEVIKCVQEVQDCYRSVDQAKSDDGNNNDDTKGDSNNRGDRIGIAREPNLCDGLTPLYKKEKCIELTTTNLAAGDKYVVDERYWNKSLQQIFCSEEFLTNNDEQECREAVNLSCRFSLKSKVKDLVHSLGTPCEVTDGGWRCPAGPWFSAASAFLKAAIAHQDPGFAKVQDQIVTKCSRYSIDEDEWLDERVEHECLPSYKPFNIQKRECSAAINGTCKLLLRGLLRKAILEMRDTSNKPLCDETEAGWDCPTLEWIKKNQSLTQEIRSNPQIDRVTGYIEGVCRP
ncbi:MAG: hypothetical protein U1F66_03880 [bacterium]